MKRAGYYIGLDPAYAERNQAVIKKVEKELVDYAKAVGGIDFLTTPELLELATGPAMKNQVRDSRPSEEERSFENLEAALKRRDNCRAGLVGLFVSTVDRPGLSAIRSTAWGKDSRLVVRLEDGREVQAANCDLRSEWPVTCCRPRTVRSRCIPSA